MARPKGPEYTPDAAKATDATIDLSERDEAAQRLVRGERVREAAKDALLNAAESHDEHDTGSQMPGEVVERTRDAKRVMGRLHDRRRRAEGATGKDAETQPVDAPDADNAVTTRGDEGAPAPRRHLSSDANLPSNRGSAKAQSMAARESTHAPGITGATEEAEASFVVVTEAESEAALADSSARALASRTSPISVARKALPPGKVSGIVDVTPTPTNTESRATIRRTVSDLRCSSERQTLQRTILADRRLGIMQAPPQIGRTARMAASSAGAATTTGTEGAIALAPVAIAALLLLLLALVIATVLMGGAVDEDQRAGAHRLAQTATDEYLLGEANGDWNHKGIKYSEFVRGPSGPKDDWAVCLVGWCMNEAGYVDVGLTDAYGNVSSYVTHFRESPDKGEVHDWFGEEYVPVEGDLFVSWYADGAQHIGIVTRCDGTTFTTVEGDVEGGPDGTYDLDEEDGLGGYVARRTRTIGEHSYTFIHPYYSDHAAGKE